MMTTEQPTTFRPTTHTLAVVSLVLSILGLLPILPVVGAIGGIVTGMIARKEIRARKDLYSGEGTAKAGIILGWIGLGLAVLLVCFIIAALIPFQNSIQTGPSIIITVQP
jgi:Domain of unknown function (DUF4190)